MTDSEGHVTAVMVKFAMTDQFATTSIKPRPPALLGGMIRSVCFVLPVMIAVQSPAAHAAPADKAALMLCGDVRDALGKDADLREAAAAAFGKNVRFQADDATEGCVSLPALLKFDEARVLITAETDPEPQAPGQSAHLSAYFLRNVGGALRLVTVKRHFADGIGSWGKSGDITPARFGADDGMMVSGATSTQGYSHHTANFYAFRNGGIVSLGTIPTGWSNGGAETDDSKEVSITAKVDTGLPQPDRVRVTYTTSAGRRSGDTIAIWRSEAGNFVLEAGSVPKDIITAFELPPRVVAKNGTAIAADAKPAATTAETHANDAWAISDAALTVPSPEVADTVKQDPAYPPICKLIGQEMTPSLSAKARTYFVTTANRCDAAQGLGPVWIVAVASPGKAEVVFSAIRHAVKAQATIRGAFHDIFVNDDARNPASGDSYTFDGKAYRKAGP